MLEGSFHHVRRGETLWRIAHSYGLDPTTLAAVNRISPTAPLIPGQRLFIPLPQESSQFLWPVRGSVGISSASRGVTIAAPPGSLVRAARSGRVAVATRHLSGWGPTVVVDHLDGYLSVYARLHQALVPPGAMLRQGTPLGTLGTRALHFEIRYGVTPRNTVALLPAE
jgi:murein DD-endopeptidase MepM/ murein hydrolase activator NlpD